MKPIIYEIKIVVSSKDLDELNHVNNAVYLQYIQEAAMQHWYASVSKEISDGMRWVARRHEIDYLKPAFLGDELVVRTWVAEFTAVTSERHYEIARNEEILVKARTVWVSLDAVTLRPKRFGNEVIAPFFG